MTDKPQAPHRPLTNNKGVAILLVIFSVSVMLFLAVELSRSSSIEYVVASQQINKLRAYHAAKSGLKVGLLRILLYKQALYSLESIGKEQLNQYKQYLDLIWSMPFMWPPTLSTELSGVQTSESKDIIKESLMKAKYVVVIESEGAKIDLNALASPIENIRKATQEQLLSIFLNKMDSDDDFSERHSDKNFEEIVFHIVDWVDEDKVSLNAGDESSFYRDMDVDSEFIPPNEPFKTIEELRMVAGINDEFFNLLKDRITVYGVSGININTADKNVLMSVDPQINEEVAKELVTHRSSTEEGKGPFKDLENFYSILTELNVDTSDEVFNRDKIPLFFTQEFNFRIKSTGQYANVKAEIEVVTFDFENIKVHLADALEEQDKVKQDSTAETPQTPPTTPAPGSTGADTGKTDPLKPADANAKKEQKAPAPKGQPRIIYWQES